MPSNNVKQKARDFFVELQKEVPSCRDWEIRNNQYLCGLYKNSTHISVGVTKRYVTVRLNLFDRYRHHIELAKEMIMDMPRKEEEKISCTKKEAINRNIRIAFKCKCNPYDEPAQTAVGVAAKVNCWIEKFSQVRDAIVK